jgi:hypothetical protein
MMGGVPTRVEEVDFPVSRERARSNRQRLGLGEQIGAVQQKAFAYVKAVR